MRRLAVVLAACLAPATAWAQGAGEWEAGAGLHYSIGDYGASEDTEITSLAFSAQRETGPWRWKLTVPILEVTGPATVIPGVGNVACGHRVYRRAPIVVVPRYRRPRVIVVPRHRGPIVRHHHRRGRR